MKIKIALDITESELLSKCREWNKSKHAAFYFQTPPTKFIEIQNIFQVALKLYEFDLAKVLIEAIAELEITPTEILLKILDLPDHAAIETICMRQDLSLDIKEKCKQLKTQH